MNNIGLCVAQTSVTVAKLDIASDSDSEGRGFESRRLRSMHRHRDRKKNEIRKEQKNCGTG